MHIEHDLQTGMFRAETEHGTAELSDRISHGTLDVRRTFVPPALRGQGIASRLVRAAYDYAKDNGWKPVATCSYAVLWLQRHPEYEGETGKDYNGPGSCAL